MAYLIALAGKGGTGKTSVAALTVRYLTEKRRGPVLAVDADSNACLNEALGIPVHTTIGHLREESLEAVRSGGDRPGGMSMEQLFDYQVHQSVIESKGVDLIVMGRPRDPAATVLPITLSESTPISSPRHIPMWSLTMRRAWNIFRDGPPTK